MLMMMPLCVVVYGVCVYIWPCQLYAFEIKIAPYSITRMNVFMTLYVALLFVLLLPGTLLRLPPGGGKWTVAFVHGLVFAFVYHLTHRAVWQWSMSF
jgi:hypothetical protein